MRFICLILRLNAKNHGTQYNLNRHCLSAGIHSERRMDRPPLLRHRCPRTRQPQRRSDQHAARAGAAGGASCLRDRHAERIRRGDAVAPDRLRKRQRRDVRPEDRAGGGSRDRAYPAAVRRVSRRQGRRHAGGSGVGRLSVGRVVVPADFRDRLRNHPLRIARFDQRRDR